MSIYKHVINQNPEPDNQKQISSGEETKVPVGIDASDDSYEYFSDKEEAEKHKRANKRTPKKL